MGQYIPFGGFGTDKSGAFASSQGGTLGPSGGAGFLDYLGSEYKRRKTNDDKPKSGLAGMGTEEGADNGSGEGVLSAKPGALRSFASGFGSGFKQSAGQSNLGQTLGAMNAAQQASKAASMTGGLSGAGAAGAAGSGLGGLLGNL